MANSDEVTSFFPDTSAIMDDKNHSESSGPSPRNADASCISAITFDGSETTLSSSSRLHSVKNIPNECSRQFNSRSKDEPLSKRILGVYAMVNKNDDEVSSSNSFHRMMSMVDALDTNKLSNKSRNNSSSPFKKGGSLYSRILSGLQEMEIDAPIDLRSTDFEIEEQEVIMDEHTSCSKENKNNNSIDISQSSTSGKKDDNEESIAEEIEVEEENFDDNISCEGSTANTVIHQFVSSSFTPSKKQDVSSSESVRGQENISEQQQQQEEEEPPHEENIQTDQWREVFDDRTGRTYYYNRRTRESRWDLPSNSIVVGRKLQVCSSSPHRRQQISAAESSLRDVSMSANEQGSSIEIDDAINQDFFASSEMASGQHDTTKWYFQQPNLLTHRDIQYQPSVSIGSPSPTWENEISRSADDDNPNSHVIANKKQHDFDQGGMKYTMRPFFCMYCGTEVTTANAMKQHLHLSCRSYSFLSQDDPEEHVLLQKVLKEVWCSNTYNHDQFVEESDKENIAPMFQTCKINKKEEQQMDFYHQGGNIENVEVSRSKNRGLLERSENINNLTSIISTNSSALNDQSINNTAYNNNSNESIFTLSDEEDTLLDIDFFQHRKQYGSTNSKNRGNNNSLSSSSSTCSTCAFCGKLFHTGDKLSRHLLLCKERQRSSKKRATRSSKNEVFAGKGNITVSRVVPPQGHSPPPGSVTNSIQSHLLTCSGRRLPGYPPITN